MEKNCLNCKYYYKNKCNNKTFSIKSENNIKDVITEFIEEGILMDSIKESFYNKELKRIFLENFTSRIIEKGYIKKNKIDDLINDSFLDEEEEITEELECIMSNILLQNRYFKNSMCNVTIADPHMFYCNYYE